VATDLKNLSSFDAHEVPSGGNMRIAVLTADWNSEITYALKSACIETLLKHNVKLKNIIEHSVPGSFELTSAASMIAQSLNPDAVICLGCVIKGETPHFDFISNAVAIGITELNIKYQLPFIFGVLTTNNFQEAKERAGGKHGNKGVEAAITALQMVALKKNLFKKKK
jgi:6,7-dimethyl-8-ribityllumazine synthase